ncbi:hypothetical protein NBRC10512v2_004261 [Rhodotorula toruloides]|uniref:Uncharacterized protein n=1 Tax=Rhodotorula toruloides (strain NP11) TaxID=1130832 RepID=M7XH13_RHOT1|nr:uncharacterized protein RHTO_04429 [Rhodotorula toruloides NP11]EMS19428.1 hypothetical protein RHTO_04429 [Rhodotorula toruloides NP11]
MDRAIYAAAPRGPTKHPPHRSDDHVRDPSSPTPTDPFDTLPRPSPPASFFAYTARPYPAATLEADRSARPRRQRLGDGGLDLCDPFGTSFVHLLPVRRAQYSVSTQQAVYAAKFALYRLQAGYVAAPLSQECVKNDFLQASEDNANKGSKNNFKKRSTASLTPKIRRPPLYRSPVRRPCALPSHAHQQPYPTRAAPPSHDAVSAASCGVRPSLAVLRRRSDQQACSTSLPTPPLSYFSTQSYV